MGQGVAGRQGLEGLRESAEVGLLEWRASGENIVGEGVGFGRLCELAVIKPVEANF